MKLVRTSGPSAPLDKVTDSNHNKDQILIVRIKSPWFDVFICGVFVLETIRDGFIPFFFRDPKKCSFVRKLRAPTVLSFFHSVISRARKKIVLISGDDGLFSHDNGIKKPIVSSFLIFFTRDLECQQCQHVDGWSTHQSVLQWMSNTGRKFTVSFC